MSDFEVMISLKDDNTVVYQSDVIKPFETKINLSEMNRKLLDRFSYWVAKENSPYERTDLELLGRILYDVLLPAGEANDPKGSQFTPRGLFESEYAEWHKKSLDDKDRFRLKLELYEKAEILGNYPWEFLFLPPEEESLKNESPMDRGFFLVGERNKLILTRFVPNVLQKLFVKTEEPLRILVAFSHPKELGNIESNNTRLVINSIKELVNLEHIEVLVVDNPTRDKLKDLMNGEEDPADGGKKPEDRTRFKPDIFHFIGHGKPNQLALMREEAEIDKDKAREIDPIVEAQWCDSREVLALFANHTPRLVFLHACETAKPDPESVKGISDLARELVYAKIPIVIAMQYTITNTDAGLFAKKFYEEIRNGKKIDEAVRAGREVLGKGKDKKASWGDRRFGTPVVYFQTKSELALINIPRSETTKTSSSDVYDPEERVSCPNPICPSHPHKITLDSVVCVMCDHELMICPQCRDKNHKYRLMSKVLGKCSCGYRPEVEPRAAGTSVSSPLKTEQAGVASAGKSSRIVQAEVASADANPKVERVETQTASSNAATS